MLARLPARIWHEWIAFYNIEPFGLDDKSRERAAHYRSAMQAANIRNMFRKKGSRASKIDDFMPKEKRQQTPDEVWGILMQYKKLADGA